METLLSQDRVPVTAEEGYARCAELARSHYENFNVASWLLPRESRRDLHAVYAYCRTVDDLGDAHKGDRLVALGEWEADLHRCYDSKPAHPYMLALQETIRRHDIPPEPFLKLIEANRMDQRVSRYATYGDLDRYCQNSANPVGRLVLYVLGYRDEERQRLSDSTCTALQLANFWQDVARDHQMGRVYLPLEDIQRFGYSDEELAEGVVNDAFRGLMAFEVARARALFHDGLGLVDTLDGRFKLDVALFSRGGMAILDAIERQDYDVLSHRPTLSRAAKLRLLVATAVKVKVFGTA